MCGTPNHYYEAIQVKVMASGWHVFSGNSSTDAHAYFYQNYFNPSNPTENYLYQDMSSCSNGRFRLAFHLQSNMTYVLLVTTFSAEGTGDFEIFASGTNEVTFKRIGKSLTFIYDQRRNSEKNSCYELFHCR